MQRIDFDALDEARITPREGYPDGHTIEEMCREIGISVDTYYKLRRGDHEPQLRTTGKILRYIENAKTNAKEKP